MHRSLGRFLFFLSLLAAPHLFAQCGVERWSVKTGTDADKGLVNVGSSTSTTIATMRGWPTPSPIPANNRVSPYETTQWVLNATLTQYKLESNCLSMTAAYWVWVRREMLVRRHGARRHCPYPK